MAAKVIDVKSASEDGSISLQLINNLIQQQQTYQLTYYVIADTISQDAMTIALATGIPRLGTKVYGMYCAKVNPRATHTVIHFLTGVLTQLWEVDVEFTSQMRDVDDTVPEVNWANETDKEHLEFDLMTGAKIQTTAGEPIFTDRQVIYQILTVRRREDWPADSSIDLLYLCRTNSDPFYGRPVGTAFMTDIKRDEDTQDNKRVVWTTYTIKFKYQFDYAGNLLPNSWQAQLANIGYQYRLTKGGKPLVNLDKTGHPIKTNLDADGKKLLDTEGTALLIQSSPSTSLNRFKGVSTAESGKTPTAADIGSVMIIKSGSPAGFNVGSYPVVGFQTIGGIDCWVLDGDPGTNGSTGGLWELQRAPITLRFNRAYTANFNALTLGPYQ